MRQLAERTADLRARRQFPRSRTLHTPMNPSFGFSHRPSGPSAAPHGVLKMPRGIALDVKNKNMLVSDKRLNAVLTFHFPEIF